VDELPKSERFYRTKGTLPNIIGDANREKKLANTVDTKFRFGSMGKMFTGVAVLQLVQAGKLKLDEPLGKRPVQL